MKRLLPLLLLFLLPFAAIAQKAGTVDVKLYFLNSKDDPDIQDCTAVEPVVRKIGKTDGIARAALLDLFKGVTDDEKERGFISFEPDATSGILKSINIKDGAAYVNFDKIVYEKLGNATTSCGSGFFTSIESTLTQFPTIKKGKVFYAIEGSTNDFYEWVQVGECPHGKKHCSSRNFN